MSTNLFFYLVVALGSLYGGTLSEGIDCWGRQYRKFVLENRMKAIVLQDVEARYARVSLRIAAGSMNDPADLQGLAHFVEHAVFLGNAIHPEPHAFYKFVLDNGGFMNGRTELDTTEFSFAVEPRKLQQALEHLFATVFYPTFPSTLFGKEVESVHSEFEKGAPMDSVREDRVLRLTSRKGHPFTFFNMGNRHTLRNATKSAAINFHRRYYTPQLMSIAIIATYKVKELEGLVRRQFLNIWTPPTVPPTWEPVWGPEELGTLAIVKSVDEKNLLSINFPFAPNMKNIFQDYYAPLLPRKCRGCLYGILDQQGYVRGILTDVVEAYPGFSYFALDISLTSQGFRDREIVIRTVFQYLKKLEEVEPQPWFWEETYRIRYQGKKYRGKPAGIKQVGVLSADLLHDERDTEARLNRHLLCVNEIPPFPAQDVKTGLALLVPANSRILISSNAFGNDTTFELYDPIYGIQYSYEHLKEKLLEELSASIPGDKMVFPNPSEAIAQHFTMQRVSEIRGAPKLLRKGKFSTVWHLQDFKFLKPNTLIKVLILSPYKVSSIWDWISSVLLNGVLARCIDSWPNYHVSEAAYAGTSVTISMDGSGLEFGLEGFSDGIEKTVSRIIKAISSCQIKNETFLLEKDKYRSRITSSLHREPCDVVPLDYILSYPVWTTEEKQEALEDLDMTDLAAFQQKFFSQISIVNFIYGNAAEKQAIEISEAVESTIIAQWSPKPIHAPDIVWNTREIQIPKARNLIFQTHTPVHTSTCTKVLVQPNSHTLREYVLLEAITLLMTQPLHVELRTRQQLGYVVQIDNPGDVGRNSLLLEIRVQGDHDPEMVERKIDKFLVKFQKKLDRLSPKEFNSTMSSLKWMWGSPNRDMFIEGDEIWKEILYNELQFMRRKNKIKWTEKLRVEDLRDFYNELFGLAEFNGQQARRVSIHVTPKTQNITHLKNPEDNVRYINITSESLSKWKKSQSLLPLKSKE